MDKIKQEAKALLADARGSHGWDHTERVLNLCLHIGKVEKANLAILELSALLHDICRAEEDKSDGKICHAESGAEKAGQILKSHGIEQKKILAVTHCIGSHRFRKGCLPETLEAKILFDSDKLDSIGAVGIGRAFLFAGETGARLHNRNIDVAKTEAYSTEDTAYREYLVKLSKIKDRLFTSEGKRLANERHNFMVEFFDRLNREVDGEI